MVDAEKILVIPARKYMLYLQAHIIVVVIKFPLKQILM